MEKILIMALCLVIFAGLIILVIINLQTQKKPKEFLEKEEQRTQNFLQKRKNLVAEYKAAGCSTNPKWQDCTMAKLIDLRSQYEMPCTGKAHLDFDVWSEDDIEKFNEINEEINLRKAAGIE